MSTDYQSYIDGFKARRARTEAASIARTDEARALLPAAARMLRDDYGAERVGVFGSLENARLEIDSDIDLFVDAVNRGRYWQAVARLTKLFGRPVDLIELVDAPPSLRARIDAEGRDVP